VFVKICGTTSEEDALLAVAMGADAVGFIFAPSPRQVAPDLVRDIVRRLPPEILTVGVFRDDSPQRSSTSAGAPACGRPAPRAGVGDDSAYVHAQVPVLLKAFTAGDPGLADALDHGADAVLVDAADPGSGKVFDWSLLEGVPSGVRRLVLAGGLHEGNVAGAIARVRPWGVDVVTGVEASPGRKDPRRLQGFVSAVRAATPLQPESTARRATTTGSRTTASAPTTGRRTADDDDRARRDGALRRLRGALHPRVARPACRELEEAFKAAWADPAFHAELDAMLRDYAGRPSPTTEARNLSERLGVRVLLKRDELNHTGSHKINNVIGQALLTRHMGKRRIIAETGAGQHGVATATAAAFFGLDCVVYMGEVDTQRQALNVFKMELLGAEVRPVTSGSRTLKDAINDAMRDWVASVEDTHYCIGSVMGPTRTRGWCGSSSG
jgi:phosphoribosylanthranilate isomerase